MPGRADDIVKTYLQPKSSSEVTCLPEELKTACCTIVTTQPPPDFDKTKEIIQSSKLLNTG